MGGLLQMAFECEDGLHDITLIYELDPLCVCSLYSHILIPLLEVIPPLIGPGGE